MPDLTKPSLPEISKKYLYLILGLLGVIIVVSVALIYAQNRKGASKVISPVSKVPQEPINQNEASPSSFTKPTSELSESKGPFNVLLLGIDRRHSKETSFRSDVNLLLSFSSDRKTVLFTSIPRDLWIDGAKINAFISMGGPDAIKEKIKKVTGFKVDRFVQIDFDAFVDAVDAVGGIDVQVERTFTDYNYPDDRSGNIGTITAEFKQGVERMDGERALIYARSRKGNNGEGSDFMRARRQQQILKALPEAFLSPRSMFNPFVLEDFYKSIQKRVKTDFMIEDVGFLYDLLQTHGDITVKQVTLDHEYLYTPNASDYGGAYVLRPKNDSFDEIQRVLKSKIQ